jgi:hypothetical protein
MQTSPFREAVSDPSATCRASSPSLRNDSGAFGFTFSAPNSWGLYAWRRRESLREGHDVEYFTLLARSLLNRRVSKFGGLFEWDTFAGLRRQLKDHALVERSSEQGGPV